jgi:hypothetical protein
VARREVTPLRRIEDFCGFMGAFMLTPGQTLSVGDEDSFYGPWAPAYFTIGTFPALLAIGIRYAQWRRQRRDPQVPV